MKIKLVLLVSAVLFAPSLALAGTSPILQNGDGGTSSPNGVGGTTFQATGSTTVNSNATRWGHNRNIVDDTVQGTTCDGSADATAAFNTAATLGLYALPQLGLNPLASYCKINYAWNLSPTKVWNVFGSGRVMNSAGDFNGPIYVETSTRPALLPNYADSPTKRWNADWSNVPIAIQVVTNPGAFGPGAGVYEYEKQQAAIYANCYSAAGRNSSNSQGSNRSGYGCLWLDVTNASTGTTGGGDVAAIFVTAGVSGSHTGATSFLANPAINGFGGQFTMLANGGWAEPIGDLTVVDKGFDSASTSVVNIFRTNATGDLGMMHMGWLVHSIGTLPVDAAFKAAGPLMGAFDASAMNTNWQTLAFEPPLVSGGTGYVAGQVLQPVIDSQWDCDQIPTFRVGQVDGSGTIYEPDFVHPALLPDRRGMCKKFPAANVTVQLTYATSNTVTPATGTGATVNFVFSKSAAVTLPLDGGISFAAYCQTGAVGGCFPPTEYLGKVWMGYNSDDGLVDLISYLPTGPQTLMQVGGSSLSFPAGGKFTMSGANFSSIRDVTIGTNTVMDVNGVNTDNTVVTRTNSATQFTFSLIDCTTFSNGRKVTFKEATTSAATSLRVNSVNGSTVEGVANYTQASKTGATYQCDYAGGLKDWVKLN